MTANQVSGSPQLSPGGRAFLNERRFCVLATINADGTPQQSTVWYELRGDEIVMNTKWGRLKDRNLRRDGRASVCVEDGYRYVAVRGFVTLVDDQAVAQSDIQRLAIRYDGEAKAAEQVRNQFSQEQRVTIRLQIEHIKEYGV